MPTKPSNETTPPNCQFEREIIHYLTELLEKQTRMIILCAHSFHPGQVQEYTRMVNHIATRLTKLLDSHKI